MKMKWPFFLKKRRIILKCLICVNIGVTLFKAKGKSIKAKVAVISNAVRDLLLETGCRI